MVMTPERLPDLSEEEQEKIYERIFDDGKKLTPVDAVYENITKVIWLVFSD